MGCFICTVQKRKVIHPSATKFYTAYCKDFVKSFFHLTVRHQVFPAEAPNPTQPRDVLERIKAKDRDLKTVNLNNVTVQVRYPSPCSRSVINVIKKVYRIPIRWT